MLSIGEDLVFVEMVHDVAVDYMLQYLTCDGGEGNRSDKELDSIIPTK
jgi:hypothetical protein